MRTTNIRCHDSGNATSGLSEMPILAEKAVEGAGLIENGQIFIAIFRPVF
jgi:hypothetical protein